MIYYRDKKPEKKIPCPGSLYNNNNKIIDLMSLDQRMYF